MEASDELEHAQLGPREAARMFANSILVAAVSLAGLWAAMSLAERSSPTPTDLAPAPAPPARVVKYEPAGAPAPPYVIIVVGSEERRAQTLQQIEAEASVRAVTREPFRHTTVIVVPPGADISWLTDAVHADNAISHGDSGIYVEVIDLR